MVLSLFRAFNRYWRLLAHYLRPHRLRMAALGLILLVTIAIQVVTPLIAGEFIDRAVDQRAVRDLVTLAVIVMVLAIVGQLVTLAETWVAEYVSWDATNAMRADLAAHLLKLDASFHNAHTQGELIERVDGDVATLARFFSRFVVYVLGNIVLVFGVLGLLCFVDWRVALGLGVFVVLAFIALLFIRAWATPYSAKERQESAEFYGFLGEYLSGLEDVRSSGAGSFVLRRCAERMRAWLAITTQAQIRGYAMVATSTGLFGLGAVFALGLSAMLYRDGALTIGMVYLVFRYTEMLREPTEQIRNEIQDLQQADASIGRIQALLATQPRLTDGPGTALPPGPLGVELDDVSFGYTEDKPILRGVSLTLAPGQVLGVVGRTGSGKSSLTRLLPRFYDPQAGTVRLGGVDVREVSLHAVRSRIGLVSQEVHLFQATVRENLTLFDETIPDPSLRAALDNLGMTPWLQSLPNGLDTRLGAGGIGLSAGQAQVLACARVFLRDPDIVILDEASSRLDPATERLVHNALSRLLEHRTAIIVAHRLDTVSFADDILVLEDGQILEHGPRQVLANDPTSHFAGLLQVGEMEAAS